MRAVHYFVWSWFWCGVATEVFCNLGFYDRSDLNFLGKLLLWPTIWWNMFYLTFIWPRKHKKWCEKDRLDNKP